MNDVIPVFKDDIVHGSIALKKCEKNHRDLNFKLSAHVKNKIYDDFKTIQYFRMNWVYINLKV